MQYKYWMKISNWEKNLKSIEQTSRTFSPSSKISDIRAENKTQVNTELQRLRKENEKLKE